MNKISKISASAALVEGVVESMIVEAPSASVIAASKVSKAATVKAPKAAKVVTEKSIVSARELAVMELLAVSEAPVATVDLTVEATTKGIEPTSMPGLIASLNKKGMLIGDRAKGVYMVVMTAMARDVLKAATAA
jgi:hypothetical protein